MSTSLLSPPRQATSAPYFDADVETMPVPELRALQLHRLQEQLGRIWERSAFFRERFERAGVHSPHIGSLEDLRRFPFVTKADLRQEQEHYPPLGRITTARPEDLRELHPTTGTTGRPVLAVWSESDLRYMVDVGARAFWAVGVRPGMVVQNALSYGLWAGGISAHHFAQRIGCFVLPVGAEGSSQRQMDLLLGLGAHVLVSTPSFALYLAERIEEAGRTEALRLRVGLFGGEPGTAVEATRRALEGALDLRAYDYYGATELGMSLASECSAQQGIHWPEDHLVVEVIDPASKEPVRPGERGVMVVTHLSHTGFPLVRYWTNDLITLAPDPCGCGRTLARSPGGITGRADDLLIFRGTNFYPTQVEEILHRFPEIALEYRIVLAHDPAKRADRCVIQVEPRPGQEALPASLAEHIREALRAELRFRPEIEVVPPNSLERTQFKAKRVQDTRPSFGGIV